MTTQEFSVWMFQNSGLKLYEPKPYKLIKRKTYRKAVKETHTTPSGVPYFVVVKPAVTGDAPDTNRITDLICDYLNFYKKWSARRISSEGRYRPELGRFIKGLNKGMEDVSCIMPNGRLLAIELKATKSDTQSDVQSDRQKEVERMGGIYILLRWTTFEDFQEIIEKIL
jgi:hypothetical protein